MAAVFAFALLEAIASHAQVLSLPVPYQRLLAMPYVRLPRHPDRLSRTVRPADPCRHFL